MSILIKGIKLPEYGKRLKMFVEYNGQVIIDKRTYFEEYEAITVPDHGDLIDKTNLMESLADWQRSEAPEEGINWDSGRNVTSHEFQYSIYRLLGDVYEEVRDEPVIIPAERSEDETD